METTKNLEEFEKEETLDEKTPHRFSSPWHFSDVVLVVEDTKFHVHRSTLSMWSPVFEKMFISEFSERDAKEIPLPGKRADEVEELLKLIYSDDAKQEVTETNYEFLLELAREYQMVKVQQHCKQYMGQGINTKNCLRRYKIAERFELKDLMEKCNKEARFKSSTNLEESDDFLELGFESKFNLCMARLKELEKALTQYADICTKLVSGYYERLSVEMPKEPLRDQCWNITSHSWQIDSARALSRRLEWSHGDSRSKYREERKEIDSSCKFCRKRINRHRYSIKAEISVMDFSSLFEQLNDLEHDDDNIAKIRKQMNASKP